MNIVRVFLSALILLVSGQVSAALISADDSFFGIGSISQDSIAGLEWLDVTFSYGRSYNDVSSEFESGGDFEGWRYATGLEFETLFFNVTGGGDYSIFTRHYYSEGSNSIDEAILMLGDTYHEFFFNLNGFTSDEAFGGIEGDNIGTHQVKGLLSDQHESLAGFIYGAGALDHEESNSGDDFSTRQFQAIGKNQIIDTYGSFLVRAISVPEPSIIILFLSGIFGLVLSRQFCKNSTL